MNPWLQLDVTVWSLLVANLVPLFGCVFLGWDTGIILIIYWSENVVVGFYTILKIISARSGIPASRWKEASPRERRLGYVFFFIGKTFVILFFLIHYGGVCGGHGLFVYLFAQGLGEGAESPFPDDLDWPEPLAFVGLLVGVIRTIFATYSTSIAYLFCRSS